MWPWQRMLKISWTEKVTNKEVLVRANEARSILKTIWRRKHRCLGMFCKYDENFVQDITERKTLGNVICGRKRIELLHDMMKGRAV